MHINDISLNSSWNEKCFKGRREKPKHILYSDNFC